MRELIVNADDFGRSPAINAGVMEGHRDGIVTSASLMVCWPAASEASEHASAAPSLDLGLHLDLGEWRLEAAAWTSVYERVPEDDRDAIDAEVHRQLELFRGLVGRDPTHLDSHQHVHLREPTASVAAGLAGELGVPLRGASAVRYVGDFYGQGSDGDPLPEAITAARLIELVRSLEPGVTELACHPGRGVGAGESQYAREREVELEALCDPRVRAAIEREGVALRSFAGLQ